MQLFKELDKLGIEELNSEIEKLTQDMFSRNETNSEYKRLYLSIKFLSAARKLKQFWDSKRSNNDAMLTSGRIIANDYMQIHGDQYYVIDTHKKIVRMVKDDVSLPIPQS